MRGFGELEAAIMQVVWSRSEPVTVREVLTTLQEKRDFAYTTVMTVMNILERKGWLRRDRTGRGRAARYEATVTREEHAASLMRAALDDVDDPATVLTHFVRQAPPAESEVLRAALTRLLDEQDQS